ncbi:MAG: aminotransferase class IV [Paludibacter sp.]
MCRVIESIKLQDGKFYRIALHQARVDKVFADFYPAVKPINLVELLIKSDFPETGIHKCRIVFDSEVQSLEYLPYVRREIKSLKLVETDMETLPYKIEDRTKLDIAFAKREACDDVLMIRNDLLTDTSYSNIALFDGENWITPKSPLLFGVNRAQLVAENKLIQNDIKVSELFNFQRISLFNAMIEFGEMEIQIDAIKH